MKVLVMHFIGDKENRFFTSMKYWTPAQTCFRLCTRELTTFALNSRVGDKLKGLQKLHNFPNCTPTYIKRYYGFEMLITTPDFLLVWVDDDQIFIFG